MRDDARFGSQLGANARNSRAISQLSNAAVGQIWLCPTGGFISGDLPRQDYLDVAMLRLNNLSSHLIPN